MPGACAWACRFPVRPPAPTSSLQHAPSHLTRRRGGTQHPCCRCCINVVQGTSKSSGPRPRLKSKCSSLCRPPLYSITYGSILGAAQLRWRQGRRDDNSHHNFLVTYRTHRQARYPTGAVAFRISAHALAPSCLGGSMSTAEHKLNTSSPRTALSWDAPSSTIVHGKHL